MREVRRVMRDDAVLFLNLGDSYCGYKGNNYGTNPQNSNLQKNSAILTAHDIGTPYTSGLKPKDLIGIPWRVAFAMQGAAVIPFSRFSAWADMLRDARLAGDWQAVEMVEAMLRQQDILASLQSDGWWLRSAIVWAKGLSFCPTYSGSVMPESVRDRPTSAYEMVFLLTKRARYYYDGDAVKERGGDGSDRWGGATMDLHTQKAFGGDSVIGQAANRPMRTYEYNGKRNLRNVWAINPAGFPGAHFATFPPALVEPCIKAGTSERGVCPACGAGWVRVTECDAGEPRPATVLDPFGGAGTTALVARQLGRDAILIELSEEYVEMTRRRLDGTEEIEAVDHNGDEVTMEQARLFSSVVVE
jgi:hypothetical protein